MRKILLVFILIFIACNNPHKKYELETEEFKCEKDPKYSLELCKTFILRDIRDELTIINIREKKK